jgi:outer membrane protein assembly factor BamB
LGIVAALRASDGAIEWLRTHPRNPNSEASRKNHPLGRHRPPSAALYNRGKLFLAPDDSAHVFALDADSGRQLWTNEKIAAGSQVPGSPQLLGIIDDQLVCSGDRMHVVDAQTGLSRPTLTWPPARRPDAVAAGRGLVAGHEVFFPTAQVIHIIDIRTGFPSRPAISLAPIGSQGANLLVAEGYLIAAGPELMMAFQIERLTPQHE